MDGSIRRPREAPLVIDGEDWTPQELATLVRRARALARAPRPVTIDGREVIRVVDLEPHWWAFRRALDAPLDRQAATDPAAREHLDRDALGAD
jgi:hypothetical protein